MGCPASTTSQPNVAIKSRQSKYSSLMTAVPGLKEVGPEITIEFITDIEGNWEYFLRYVSMSIANEGALYFAGGDRGLWGPGTLSLKKNGILVFGGDAVDKGTGDIRVVKTLLDLKERYPTQVFLVLGNRDINKLRFYSELAEGEDGSHFTPSWLPNPTAYLDYIQEKGFSRGRVSTLRWMLDCNMGCKDTTFITRQRELAYLNGRATETDVLNSFRNSVDPSSSECFMLDLIRVGQIAVVLGDSLFVHSGIQEESLGFVPDAGDARYDNVWDWAAALNKWKNEQICEFELNPGWSQAKADGSRRRGGQNLMNYGCPLGGKHTVIYFNPLQKGNAQRYPHAVEDFLSRSLIRRVLTGHQPHGQAPLVVRHPRTGLLTIACDNSFSDLRASKLFNAADNRGSVVCLVQIKGSAVRVKGTDRTGAEHGYRLETSLEDCKMPDLLVGMQLRDGSWIKTVYDNRRVVTCLGRGFELRVMCIHPGQGVILLAAEYRECSSYFASHKFREFTEEWVSASTLQKERAGLESDFNMAEDLWSKPFTQREFFAASCYITCMDGVISNVGSLEAEKAAASVINALRNLGKRVIFLTSHSKWSKNNVKEYLSGLGIEQPADDIAFVGGTCSWLLNLLEVQRPYVLSSERGLEEELERNGISPYLTTVDKNGQLKAQFSQPSSNQKVINILNEFPDVDAVVVDDDVSLTAIKVAVAVTCIKMSRLQRSKTGNGAAKCLDLSPGQRRSQMLSNSGSSLGFFRKDPGGNNPIHLVTLSEERDQYLGSTDSDRSVTNARFDGSTGTPGAGAICDMISSTCDMDIQSINVGKPGAFLAEQLRRPKDEDGYGVDFGSTILIGHQLETDIAFANLCGMSSLLVRSGATKDSHLDELRTHLQENPSAESLSQIPTWVLDKLPDVMGPAHMTL